jgi:hypothetical protein
MQPNQPNTVLDVLNPSLIFASSMKRLFYLCTTLLAFVLLAGCENDIEINAPWRETPVVYGFLDPNTGTQYLRIQKTYQNSTSITTEEGAKINDSLYFDSIVVKVKSSNQNITFTKTTEIPKEAGCFAIVLEKIPSKLATQVAQSVKIPIIGIGAGSGVDGQVLVSHDMLGINKEFSPKFLRRYLNLYDEIKGAVEHYVADVKSVDFPNEKEQY